MSLALSKKSGGTLFLASCGAWWVARGAWCVARGAWRVVRGAWRVVRGAWCVARGAWFRIFSRYLVPLTPPTVFVRSFWNFTGALRMVWRYACGFCRILNLIFITLHILNLDIFWVLILQKCIGSRYLVPLTPPRSFWPNHLKLYMGF